MRGLLKRYLLWVDRIANKGLIQPHSKKGYYTWMDILLLLTVEGWVAWCEAFFSYIEKKLDKPIFGLEEEYDD